MKYRQMKFWCENLEQLTLLSKMLDALGYTQSQYIQCGLREKNTYIPIGIATELSGKYVAVGRSREGYWWEDVLRGCPEYDISWLIPEESEYVEFNGVQYVKSELEEALRLLTPVVR